MTANVALTDTFAGFKDKTNEVIVMTQTDGMSNFIKLLDTTQATSNTTGSIITAGGVGIAKDVIVGGNVNVHGNLHANGAISADGSLTFGDAATDNVVFAADVNSHIIPNTDDTYDLGSTGQQWRNLYLNGTANLDIVDIDGAVQIDAAVTVGVAGTGQDVIFYGDTSGKHLLWDQSGDELVLINAAKISFWDAAGGENIIATSDGHLEINAGTTLDITAPTVDVNVSTTLNIDGATQLTGAVTVGINGTGHDVIFYGDTTGRNVTWDQDEDALHFADNTEIKVGSLAAGDMVLYHDGTNSYIKNAVGALKIATETSGIAVTIGHGTSEVTVADNLTVAGDLTVTGTTVQSVVMADKEIEIGAVTTPSDTTANLGGLRLKGATDKTITWTNSLDSWVYNQGITVGEDDTGYDVTFYGATSGAYMRWDENVDDLLLVGDARAVIPDGQLVLGSTPITSTATELNLLDGVAGLVQADFTKLAAITQSAVEINAHTSPGDVMALAIALG